MLSDPCSCNPQYICTSDKYFVRCQERRGFTSSVVFVVLAIGGKLELHDLNECKELL